MRKFLITIPFLAAVILTHPFENIFYGGDDWGYAWPVINFLSTGKLALCKLASVPAIPQILYASFVSGIFGFSLRALNLSMIVIGTIGIIVCYRLIKELGLGDRNAALGAVFMSATPLYISFAASFMSDMMYTVLMLSACLEYVRGLKSREIKYVFYASILSAAAFLSRQIGFSLFAAFLLAIFLLIYKRKMQIKEGLYFLLIGSIIPTAIFIAHFILPGFFGGHTITESSGFYPLLINSAVNLIRNIGYFFRFWNHMVILLFPLCFVFFWQAKKHIYGVIKHRFKTAIYIMFLYSVFALVFIVTNKPLLIGGDFLHPGFVCKELVTTGRQSLLWNCLVLASSIPTSILFCLLLERLKMINIKKMPFLSNYAGWFFLAVTFFIQVTLTCVYPGFCNNYFLPLSALLVPFLIKLFDFFSVRSTSIVAYVTLCLTIIISVLLIEPYHSSAEASWKEADRLVKSGIDSRKIYAMPSWYAWNNYDFSVKKKESIFVFIKNNSSYLISELPLEKLSSIFYHLKKEDMVYYRTLLGRRPLYLYSYAHSN